MLMVEAQIIQLNWPKLRVQMLLMSLSQEIKLRAFGNFRAREIDSTYRKRIGKVKLRIFIDGINNLFSLFKIRFI